MPILLWQRSNPATGFPGGVVHTGLYRQNAINRQNVLNRLNAINRLNVLNRQNGLNRDGNRSAFTPYRHSTVLTNLQRGNVQTENTSVLRERSTHELAAQGELFSGDISFDENFDYSFDPNQTDKNGLTPLMWAASYGQRATVKKLIDLGSDTNKVGGNGETALILASSAGHIAVVKELLKHYAIIDHRDGDGNSALYYAAYNNHGGCVRLLLDAGASFTFRNECGDNLYDIMCQRRSTDALEALRNYVLNIKQELNDECDKKCRRMLLLTSAVSR
ncbi:ankyrin repeat family A protein 2 [Trichonephila inaurata madagascariensis]|uniref:Ankyrin repeat family A protein 2 n=1 Tax=Trichonephila inaurata madagascariensis TaxID=2747483 RepID=A0A8X6XJ01_9ARAC|nr:ankyrin repeat family A protein 2 [Trichonephila inaurata madagascariensis]